MQWLGNKESDPTRGLDSSGSSAIGVGKSVRFNIDQVYEEGKDTNELAGDNPLSASLVRSNQSARVQYSISVRAP